IIVPCDMASGFKLTAEQLYINTDFSQAEIAKIVGVLPNTVSRWVNANDGSWKTARVARSVTKEKLIQMYYKQLYNLNKDIEKRDDKPYPTSSEADTISKIVTQVERLEKGLSLSNVYTTTDEILAFAKANRPKDAEIIGKLLLDYLKKKANG
ncbi:MAG: hypothetical protein ACPG5P_01860, partial [Saprospiraceae bacterium]